MKKKLETWDIGQKKTSSVMLGDTQKDENKEERMRDVEDKGARSNIHVAGVTEGEERGRMGQKPHPERERLITSPNNKRHQAVDSRSSKCPKQEK